jgi:hypothetical protein
MPLLYRAPQDPTADRGKGDDLASCAASRLLQRELQHYCDAELSGRSVLVAGLRGAGKTWLVEGSLKQLIRRSRRGLSPQRRPLVVRLTGPQIFDVLKDDTEDSTSKLARTGRRPEPEPGQHDKTLRMKQKQLFRHLLEQVTLGLHSALSQEIVYCIRDRASSQGSEDLHELAAALDISLPEGPSPSTMRDFWRQTGQLDGGVLFMDRGLAGAGMKELAALSGISYAYKRVAGRLVKTSVEKSNASTTTSNEAAAGAAKESRWADLIKPFAALLAGTTVTAATIGEGVLNAALLGMAATLFSTLLFRFSTSSVRRDEDSRDETFIPNTDAETLDRVLPQLVARLSTARLAPVIVIDELDKVNGLWDKVLEYELLDQFKKLFAERVFTCLLVNRDFMERLRIKSAEQPFGRFHSYFTHRTYVSFEPAEMHAYLEHLIEPVHG